MQEIKLASKLEKFLKLDGVKAAGEFKKDGSLEAFTGLMNTMAVEDLGVLHGCERDA